MIKPSSLLLAVLLLSGCASAPPAASAPEFARIESSMRLGIQAVQSDQWERAAGLFDEAGRLARSVDQRRLEAMAELNLAWLEDRSGLAEQSGRRLNRLLDLKGLPDDLRAELVFRLAKQALQQNQLEQSKRYLDMLENRAGKKAMAAKVNVLHARLALSGGDAESALKQLGRIDFDERDEVERLSAVQLEARALLALKRPEAALQRLQSVYDALRAQAKTTSLVENLNLQAEAYRLQQQPEQAEQRLSRAKDICKAWLDRFNTSKRWRPAGCTPS